MNRNASLIHYENPVIKKESTTKVEKLWGKEIIYSRKPYALKLMKLNPGGQVSVHFHKDKAEEFILLEGTLIVEIKSLDMTKTETIVLTEKYSSISIEPMTPHTFYCPDTQKETTLFIETSTEDKDHDSYRLTKSTSNRRSNN